jgi:hypothetical protein
MLIASTEVRLLLTVASLDPLSLDDVLISITLDPTTNARAPVPILECIV